MLAGRCGYSETASLFKLGNRCSILLSYGDPGQPKTWIFRATRLCRSSTSALHIRRDLTAPPDDFKDGGHAPIPLRLERRQHMRAVQNLRRIVCTIAALSF